MNFVDFVVLVDYRVMIKDYIKETSTWTFLGNKKDVEVDGDSDTNGGARGVTVIVVGNEHGDTSSKPGRGWLYFT